MTDLESRAREAAAGLLRSVDEIDIPDAPAWGHRRVSRGPALLVLAAAVVAVLVTAAVVTGRGGDGANVAAGGGDVPRLVPGPLPKGLEVTGGIDLPFTTQFGVHLSLHVYGHPAAEDPFADGDLGIIVARGKAGGEADDDLTGEGVTPVKVRGRNGAVRDGDRQGLGDRVLLNWSERPGLTIYLASASLDLAGLQAVAENLTVDADGEVDPGRLPDGLEAVGAVDPFADTGVVESPMPARARGSALGTGSSGQGQATRGLSVVTFAGGQQEFDVARWHVGPGARPVMVRGHRGVIATKQTEGLIKQAEGVGAGAVVTLVWRETPNAVVSVVALGVTEDEVMGVATSLREASDEEWAALTSSSRSTAPTTSTEVERTTGGP